LNQETFTSKLSEFILQMEGEEGFAQWLSKTGYNSETFKLAYQRELDAAWQRDQIISQVKNTAEQIHARQILVFDQDLAEDIYKQLQAGSDFATLAKYYDPVTQGELGWFPRGYLFLSEIEEAVFALLPGQYTEIIQTSYGFHIVQVVEREESRPLTSDAKQLLERKALEEWIADRRTHSQIEILIQ
jgi:peptidyl-prolyl cis-trans isomerase C